VDRRPGRELRQRTPVDRQVADLDQVVDATLVRGVLVPASMRLLGERSWYAPPALQRLHARVGLTEA
jgi:uncharacterized membrane protein YdfJ with MMPL/SSD domain